VRQYLPRQPLPQFGNHDGAQSILDFRVRPHGLTLLLRSAATCLTRSAR
jgi:hypothetical protein